MAATLYELDMANIFAGDEDPTNSQHLAIEDVKLPQLQEKTKEHAAGGAVFGVKIGLRLFEPLEQTFKLRGFNPEVMNKFGVNSPTRRKYTTRGNVRDLRTGATFAAVAVVQGRMVKVEPSSWKRDDGLANDYTIDEIVFYQLMLNGAEKYYFDYFAGPIGWRVDGVAQFADEARNLGLA
jgi:P2 family phage contractile tail tube protein